MASIPLPRPVIRWQVRPMEVVIVAGIVSIMAINMFRLVSAPAIEYPNAPFPTGSVVTSGTMVPVTVTRCGNDPEPLWVDYTRSLINADTGESYGLLDGSGYIYPGCATTTGHVTIPVVPAGRYYIQGIAVADGRWKTTTARWYTRPFEITVP